MILREIDADAHRRGNVRMKIHLLDTNPQWKILEKRVESNHRPLAVVRNRTSQAGRISYPAAVTNVETLSLSSGCLSKANLSNRPEYSCMYSFILTVACFIVQKRGQINFDTDTSQSYFPRKEKSK